MLQVEYEKMLKDKAYARGLKEGEAKGLERAAEIVAANGFGVLPDMLRDEAAKIRGEK